MKIEFQRLNPETVSDFLDFFDNDAFPEGDEWANCYCLEGHLVGEKDIFAPAVRREHAKRLVLEGKLTGYLLRDADADSARIIGWAKAGDRCGFVDPDELSGLFSLPSVYGEVKSLYCIDLVPEYQGKGIARQVVEMVISDAELEGYKYVEVYPAADRTEKRNYRGHAGMYESLGFEAVRSVGRCTVMRKKLG